MLTSHHTKKFNRGTDVEKAGPHVVKNCSPETEDSVCEAEMWWKNISEPPHTKHF